jgi:hypothetical protein
VMELIPESLMPALPLSRLEPPESPQPTAIAARPAIARRCRTGLGGETGRQMRVDMGTPLARGDASSRTRGRVQFSDTGLGWFSGGFPLGPGKPGVCGVFVGTTEVFAAA